MNTKKKGLIKILIAIFLFAVFIPFDHAYNLQNGPFGGLLAVVTILSRTVAIILFVIGIVNLIRKNKNV